jgi:hypothetical protein
LETVGPRVPAQNIRDFSLFSACSSSRTYPSASSTSTNDVACREGGVLGTTTFSLKSNFVMVLSQSFNMNECVHILTA